MAYLGQAVAFTRISVDADGLPTNGDSNPTAVLYRNGEATAESVTPTTTANTGQFKYSFTIPGSWNVGDFLQVVAEHEIDAVVYPGVIWEDMININPASVLGSINDELAKVPRAGHTHSWKNSATEVTVAMEISEAS